MRSETFKTLRVVCQDNLWRRDTRLQNSLPSSVFYEARGRRAEWVRGNFIGTNVGADRRTQIFIVNADMIG